MAAEQPPHELSPSSSEERAARMRNIRQTFGPTQAAFCNRYGFTIPQWSNFERGMPVGFAAAQTLVMRIPGLSLDWIYAGAIGNLSVSLARSLDELPPA